MLFSGIVCRALHGGPLVGDLSPVPTPPMHRWPASTGHCTRRPVANVAHSSTFKAEWRRSTQITS
jgi:hypothetical protein